MTGCIESRRYNRLAVTLTLSLDDSLVAEARRVAASRGLTLDSLIHGYLEDLVQAADPGEFSRRLRALSAEGGGRSGGVRIDRGSLHERSDVP